jgi:hypothetical protein
MMHSGPCKDDFDWKKDWEAEQQLTPDELRLKEFEEEQNRRIQQDIMECIRDIKRREEREAMMEEFE